MSVDNYEKAMASGEEIKQKMLEEYSGDVEMTEERRNYIAKCWPLDNMDQEELDEYM